MTLKSKAGLSLFLSLMSGALPLFFTSSLQANEFDPINNANLSNYNQETNDDNQALESQLPVASSQVTIFFDLGNTLIDTNDMSKPGEIPVRKTLRWISEAKRIVEKVSSQSIKVGLITNVPKTWSVSDLKKFVGERWRDENPFSWSVFEERIQMPTLKIPAKPSAEIFQAAQKLSPSEHYIYVGEDERELRASCTFGFSAYKIRPILPNGNSNTKSVNTVSPSSSSFTGLDESLQPFCTPSGEQNAVWNHLNLSYKLLNQF